eukprot:Opistho-2@12777
MAGAEGHRGADPEQAARHRIGAAGDDTLGLLDLAEDAGGPLEIDLALRGELQAARRAHDEAGAQPVLDACDQLADRRWRQAELPAGSGEALQQGGPDEDLHLTGAIVHEWPLVNQIHKHSSIIMHYCASALAPYAATDQPRRRPPSQRCTTCP